MQRSSNLAERNRLEMYFPGQMPIRCKTQGFDRCTTIVKECGKEGERDLDFLPEDTIIALVLSSLNLSLLTVIQVLTSSALFCMERRPGAADFWS